MQQTPNCRGRPKTLEDQEHWKTKNTGRPKTLDDQKQHKTKTSADTTEDQQKPNTLKDKILNAAETKFPQKITNTLEDQKQQNKDKHRHQGGQNKNQTLWKTKTKGAKLEII